ncbi:MAG: hypothetical protein ACP5GO_04250 [Thermoprotei archaeon]
MIGALPPPSYPRPYPLGEALRKKKKNVDSLLNRYVSELIELQRKASLDAVTDGRLLWDNVVEGSASLLSGWKKGDLTRFFDNNYFYRRPIKEKVQPLASLESELKYLPWPNRLFTILGPLSFNVLSYGEQKVDWDYARAISSVLKGYEGWLAIQEPSLLESGVPDDLGDALKLFPSSAKKLVMVYFRPFSPIYDKLLDLPAEGLWLDCVSDPYWATTLKQKGQKRITVLGLIDARTTKMERVEDVLDHISSAELSSEVYIAPNWGFDIIPYSVSKQKTRLLGSIKKRVEVS